MGKLKSKFKYIITNSYIYIKSKGIYPPENLMGNGSSRHDDAAQTIIYIYIYILYMKDSDRPPVSNRRPILKSASNFQIYGRFSLSQIDVQ